MSVLRTILWMTVMISLASFVNAQSMMEVVMGPGLVTLNALIALATIILGFVILPRGGRILGRAFVFMIASAFVFGSTRFFFYLTEETSILPVSETTMGLWWHFLFYTATGLFLYALHCLRTYSQTMSDPKALNHRNIFIFGVLAVWIIILFASALPLDGITTAAFEGTFLDKIGFIHMVAFCLIWYTGYQLMIIKKMFGKTVSGSVRPFLVSLALFGLIHFWEVLFETTKIIKVSGEIGEEIESILFLGAMIAFFIAIWRIKQAIPKVQ